MQFTQVLAPHAGDLPLAERLVACVAAVVSEPSRVSAAVAAASRAAPLPQGWAHVKRVRRARDGAPCVPPADPSAMLVLLGPGDAGAAAPNPRAGEALAALAGLAAGFVRVAVPRHQPRSREQLARESRLVWPMGWVQPAGFAAATEEAPLGPGEAAYFAAAMRLALDAAGRASAGGAHLAGRRAARACVLALPPGRSQPELGSAVAATDADGGGGGPEGGATEGAHGAPPAPRRAVAPHEFIVRAVATAGGAVEAGGTLPTRTAVVAAIGQVAAADGGAAPPEAGGAAPAVACSSPLTAQHANGAEPARVAADEPPPHKRRRPDALGGGDDHPCAGDGGGTPPSSGAARAAASVPIYQPCVPGGYVCTGHDAFLTHEPGPLDAMALLHARVARVVFASPEPCHGALGGAGAGGLRLQELRSVNHRYLVYRAHLHVGEGGAAEGGLAEPSGLRGSGGGAAGAGRGEAALS